MSEEAATTSESVLGTDTGSSSSDSQPDWRASLSEEFRNDPSLADIQDVNGLAKSYVHAQRLVGADKVALPRQDAPPEEWNDLYDKLGRPEKYEITRPTLAEGLDYDNAMEEKMLGLMHEAGLSQGQAQKIYSGYMEHMTGGYNEMNKTRELERTQWDHELRSTFGKAYDEQVSLAQRAAAEFGGDEFRSWLNETGLGDHPMLVKMFAKIGQQVSESRIDPQGRSQSFMLTPDGARQEIARLQRDADFMRQYSDAEVDGHKEAIEKMQQLFSFAYPDQVEQV